jgi:hypothetical protein
MNMLTRSEAVYFCPRCGSAALELPGLVDGLAKCGACEWTGPSGELFVQELKHEHGEDRQVIERLMLDFRAAYGKHCALPLGAVLHKWGFIGTERQGGQEVLNVGDLKVYMAAMARASMAAVLETRVRLEREKARGQQG